MSIVRRALIASAVVLCWSQLASATAPVVRSFFQQHCLECHGAEQPKADLRLDVLADPVATEPAIEKWTRVLEVIETGEMPPPKQRRPDSADVAEIIRSIRDAISQSAEARPLALRRLNRVEYENTVHDLLGIRVPLADLLPEDGTVQGFDNVAGGLSISGVLMERYLEAADVAFEDVIRRIKPLPAQTRRAVLMEIDENIESVKKKKGGTIEVEGSFVKFTPGWPPARVDVAHPIEDGMYRCRVAVWPHNPSDRTLAVAIYVGPLFGPGKRRLMGIYDVTGTPQDPRVVEFTTYMEEGHTIHIVPRVFPEHVTWRDKHEPRPGVGIRWAETHGPLDQAWPAETQRRLFGDADSLSMVEDKPIYMRHRDDVKLHNVQSDQPRKDIERILRDFVPRAFRRPVEDSLIQQYVALAQARLDIGRTFEQAVRAGVTAVLCSPHFLLLNQNPSVDDYTLASRLSYFLWSTMPDDELMQLAAEGKLRDPKVRSVQVERMLRDPRSEQFVRNFTGQWLDLREIEFTTPDEKLYPEFDELLQAAMLEETRGFFTHVLDNDLSVLNFIDSDFTVLNERLAMHYGIPGVKGHENFRVTKIPEASIRGGLLTHASVLKVTANGTSTSPILRGVWVLENILGEPAAPPPAGVPAVEPDIRGATTIREQLDKHRSIESCARCHVRIDPPGFAMEIFNPIGGQRDWYRSLGEGEKVEDVSYRVGLPVEAGGVTADGQTFDGFREYRRMLQSDGETIARAIAAKLLIYGTGRPLTAADGDVVDSIVDASRADEFGLRSMVHAVVESDWFTQP